MFRKRDPKLLRVGRPDGGRRACWSERAPPYRERARKRAAAGFRPSVFPFKTLRQTDRRELTEKQRARISYTPRFGVADISAVRDTETTPRRDGNHI